MSQTSKPATAERTRGETGALARFAPATRAWFAETFVAPTDAQSGAWEAIADGEHALVVAPTGSGKTLAAFLWSIDRILSAPQPEPARRCRVLYVSPLKALASDVERNLSSPLVGISRVAARQEAEVPAVRVGVRTGDTPASERRRLATAPPDILITTPESLFLILTSAARAGLAGVETVILDEVHVLAGSKRGAHLALSLERLDAMLEKPAQRVGLSATVRPVETVMAFLSGTRPPQAGGRVTRLVQPPATKQLRIDVEVPVPDLTDLGSESPASTGIDLSGPAAGPTSNPEQRASIWPVLTQRLLDIVRAHRSTLIFTNGRRTAERLTARLNETWAEHLATQAGADVPAHGSAWPSEIPGQSGVALGAEATIARAHHGSMSREERTRVEEELKSGRLPAVVATSSLELGIDMGAIDVVVQVGSPPSVASALQRIGRAGHQVGAVSHGVMLPTHRADLLPAAVTAMRARAGAIEAVHPLENPLDVLAQHIVAMLAVDDWRITELAELVRRARPFATLGTATLEAVLDMLAGRYPSEDFASLRARIVWDREAGTLAGRPGIQQLATTSGGTIPDRGLFGVYLAGGDDGADQVAQRGGRRVGELDEEMVFESRAGDTFTLGSSTWRIERITADRVLVTPAPGLPGRLPFWRGDSPARPFELGEELGRLVREASGGDGLLGALEGWDLSEWSRDNLAEYLTEQLAATGHLPTDTTIVIERFRDDIGDWRVVIHTPFGGQVHAPWAVVIGARLRAQLGSDVGVMHTDDGIVLRIPDVADPVRPEEWEPPGRSARTPDRDATQDDWLAGTVTLHDLLLAPDEVSTEVVSALGGSAHFAARFREAASRSLLLPRRRPNQRQPLWQQRQRAAQLLAVASRFPDFPVVLEAVRECLQDDFDTPALVAVMRRIENREIRVVEVTTPTPSPFARSMLFAYVGSFLYDGDAPLAERRAAALTLDPSLLAELLGEDARDLADLLDPAAVAAVEAEVGLRTEYARVTSPERLVDLVARIGPLALDDVKARCEDPNTAAGWLAELEQARRVIQVRLAGEAQWAVVEDAARLRDALGVALPPGIAETFLTPVPDPLGDLIRRHARSHAPFTAADLAGRFALAPGTVTAPLALLVAGGAVVAGRLRPGSEPGAQEYCDAEVLRRIRRRSLAAARAEVEAVPARVLGVFAPRWHQLGQLRGSDGVLTAVEQLAGLALDVGDLETSVLPARVIGYRPELLDSLTAAGEVIWVGTGHPSAGGSGGTGVVTLLPVEATALLAPELATPTHPLAPAVVAALREGGRFFRDLVQSVLTGAADLSAADVEEALWDAVWCGLVTNDTLAPVRALAAARNGIASRRANAVAPRARRIGRRSLLAPALALEAARGGADGGTSAHRGASPIARISTPPTAAGRWSLVPPRGTDPALRATAKAASLLERYGVLLRGVAATEGVAGGFSALYPVLARLEETGAVRRGYLVEGQGAAQFALPECVDRLRADAHLSPASLVMAAADPANPYGSLLPWPEPSRGEGDGTGRPRRVAGADVVLVDGALAVFLERGGGSALRFTDDPAILRRAATALVEAAGSRYSSLTLKRIDGGNALTGRGALRVALGEAGFVAAPQGLRPPRGGRGGRG